MTPPPSGAPYTLRGLHEMLGLPKSTIVGFIREGFVTPGRGARNEYRFGFQDVVLLRTAQSLKAEGVPTRRVLRALRRLRSQLPATLPLTGLRVVAVGDDVVVRERGQSIAAESGQLLFDFDARPAALPATLATLPSPAAAPGSTSSDARERVAAGERIEGDDPAAAEADYRAALAIAPEYVAASLNLGALLYEAGRLDEAVALYSDAMTRTPDEPLLAFNRALALEDLGRHDAALVDYERCLALAPDFADAHWNAARLYDASQRPQQALQHFSAYRRLQR